MNPERVEELLGLGEGQSLEFKSSVRSLDILGRIVCGFLNSAGGYLICGVNEKGEVTGIDSSTDTVRRIEQEFIERISPRAFISVQVERLENKQTIVIEVPAGKDVPYAFKDVIYIRSGAITKKADAEIIRDIVMRHQIEPERWERRFSFAEIMRDVDPSEVKAAVNDAEQVKRAFFRDASQTIMVLEDFSVARYGHLTNGGDVLFARDPAVRLPQVRVRAMRYNSDKAGDTFSDMKSFEGPLHRVFEEAYTFIVRNTPTVSRFIKGSPKRQDTPLYPERAVREALINALAHRDYSAASGGVSIHVFPRRLEVWNSGPLPDGVTEESLLKGQISVLRNPDIAHVLYLRGLMEKAGRGSVLMVQMCREHGLAAPFWKSDPSLGVTVTFTAPEVTGEVTGEVAPEVAPEVTGEVTGEVAPEVTPEVTPEMIRLLQHLSGEMNRQDLQLAMELKDAEHFRKAYLLPALKLNVIEMTNPDKPRSSKQKYRLTAKGKRLVKRGSG